MTVSSKIRLYDLAKELKLDTKRLIEEVRREGVDVSVPSNSVSKELAEKIRNKYFPKKETAVKRGVRVVKRAERAIEEPPAEVAEPAAAEAEAANQPLKRRQARPSSLHLRCGSSKTTNRRAPSQKTDVRLRVPNSLLPVYRARPSYRDSCTRVLISRWLRLKLKRSGATGVAGTAVAGCVLRHRLRVR